MPNINGINISDTEFTAMQELGTAFICERALKTMLDFVLPKILLKIIRLK